MTEGPSPARFISLEGGEGSGKSLQAKALAAALEKLGRKVVLTREPGGTPGAEAIRALLVTGEKDRWTPLSEALLFSAARADHLARKIRPALEAGQWVICDRFADSTRAYQGAAHGLTADVIGALEALTLAGTKPDLTLLIDVPVAIGLARAAARGGHEARYEAFDTAFHERLRQAYLAIAKAEPERCVVIDGTKAPDAVTADIMRVVEARFAL